MKMGMHRIRKTHVIFDLMKYSYRMNIYIERIHTINTEFVNNTLKITI